MSDHIKDPALEFAKWVHEELVTFYANETEAWALDRVSRVMAAHHDLGHLKLFGKWARWIPRISGAGYLAAITRVLEYRAYGPEKEADADAYAVELCVDAGFNGEMCLQAIEILENLTLDHGDIDGVFGPENLLDPTDPDRNSRTYAMQRWLWTKARGYLPLRERRERAKAQLERKRARDGRVA